MGCIDMRIITVFPEDVVLIELYDMDFNIITEKFFDEEDPNNAEALTSTCARPPKQEDCLIFYIELMSDFHSLKTSDFLDGRYEIWVDNKQIKTAEDGFELGEGSFKGYDERTFCYP